MLKVNHKYRVTAEVTILEKTGNGLVVEYLGGVKKLVSWACAARSDWEDLGEVTQLERGALYEAADGSIWRRGQDKWASVDGIHMGGGMMKHLKPEYPLIRLDRSDVRVTRER